MKSLLKFIILLSGIVFTLPSTAQIKLPAVIGDNMVLQQNSEVAIWGWGDPGSFVKVSGSWSHDTVRAMVSNEAEWLLKIKTPSAGGPFTLSIKGNDEVLLKNIMIGEVWICSGQSNMEWSADSKINNGDEEVKNANFQNIRFFHVKKMGSATVQNNCFAKWEPCTPETMHSFSAIGYFFSRNLNQKLNVPIGIIEVAWGGTPAEAWTRKDLVDADPLLKSCAAKLGTFEWWPSKPGVLYNGMIAPLLPYRIAGAIWYQGESNAETSDSYQKLLKTLIGNWRHDFGTEFPFYFVQIAPFAYGADAKAPIIREMQMKTLEVPRTGMVVVSDLVDNVKDIHPRNKQDVGLRLANLALAENYGVSGLAYKNPMYKSMSVEKGKVRISFDNVTSGLKTTGKEITCFEIAGDDKVFKPAKVKIDGNTAIVSSKEVKAPAAVRFSFSNDAIGNLFSNEGLPVAPFRTDDWKY